MLILTMICFLAGAIFGLRFKMLILVPAIGLALAMVAINGVVVEQGAWQLAFTMVVVATSIQLGYFGGIALQFVTRATRAADRRGSSRPTATEGSPSGRMRASSRFETSKQLHQV